MKSSSLRSGQSLRQHVQTAIDRHIAGIFARMPMLSGFALSHELEVTNLTASAWPGGTPGEELCQELLHALADLAEERPDAVEVLRGRTFARVFH